MKIGLFIFSAALLAGNAVARLDERIAVCDGDATVASGSLAADAFHFLAESMPSRDFGCAATSSSTLGAAPC